MRNISFDNPWLLLIAIPVLAAVIIPFFIAKNKDNKSIAWNISLVLHIAIVLLVSLAVAGLAHTTLVTKTTVYVLADVSYSSERNLDQIDDYISQIKENLPQNTKLGVVCFGKDSVVLTSPGRQIKSVKEAEVDTSQTDIVKALNHVETLFKGDTLKKVILITDGNDTVTESSGSIASTVGRLTDNGIKIDAIFLDNSLEEGEEEVQLMNAEYLKSCYYGSKNEVKLLIQTSTPSTITVKLYGRKHVGEGETPEEYQLINVDNTSYVVEAGLFTLPLNLWYNTSDDTKPTEDYSMDYMAEVYSDGDISPYNNTYTFTQNISVKEKILHITGNTADIGLIEKAYGEKAEINSYTLSLSKGASLVPFTVEELVLYDQIILSNFDVTNIDSLMKNANAFVNNLDLVISQYGKSLLTFGDLKLHINSDSRVVNSLKELLPVEYGSINRSGRLYTIVLDISHSMFMASKFTVAKQAAIRLLSVLDNEDYVCLITYSGDIHVQTPRKVKDCKDDLIQYIDSLTTEHGTDLAKGLEEALKKVETLNLAENQVMVISDGFSFESEKTAASVAQELRLMGASVSAINTYIYSDGNDGKNALTSVATSGGGKIYEIMRPEDVDKIVLFGDMADDMVDAIIAQDSPVLISKYNDEVVNGIKSFDNVKTYIASIEKYDATTPIKIVYTKGGHDYTIPLYSYRSHGNGRVSSFTTTFASSWIGGGWSLDEQTKLISNMLTASRPKQNIESPYSVYIDADSKDALIEVIPSVLRSELDSSATLKITLPDGRVLRRDMTFDSPRFFYSFDTGLTGTYIIETTYTYKGAPQSYTEVTSFDIAHLPEYDAFASFDKYSIYEFMRGNGTVTSDGIPDLSHNKNEITTYKQSYVIPLLIIAICLFVLDILVRKIRIRKRRKMKKVAQKTKGEK